MKIKYNEYGGVEAVLESPKGSELVCEADDFDELLNDLNNYINGLIFIKMVDKLKRYGVKSIIERKDVLEKLVGGAN